MSGHGWYNGRPTSDELEEIEAALNRAYPWFMDLWPRCPAGHRMFQLGLNPEPAVVVVRLPGPRHAVRCLRCKRQADRDLRERKRRKNET